MSENPQAYGEPAVCYGISRMLCSMCAVLVSTVACSMCARRTQAHHVPAVLRYTSVWDQHHIPLITVAIINIIFTVLVEEGWNFWYKMIRADALLAIFWVLTWECTLRLKWTLVSKTLKRKVAELFTWKLIAHFIYVYCVQNLWNPVVSVIGALVIFQLGTGQGKKTDEYSEKSLPPLVFGK